MNYSYATFLDSSTNAPPEAAVLTSMLMILAIDVRLIFYCLDDLNRHELVAGGDKSLWTAVIVLGGPLGQAIYWLYGRGPY